MENNIILQCKSLELPMSEITDNNRISVVACVTGEWEHPVGKFTISNDDLEHIKTDFEKKQRDILFDYDHQCFYNNNSVASGWGKAMSINDNQLEIEVEFTPAGLEKVKNKEYRYLSPVYLMSSNRKDRKVTLHSVALTNIPFLKELPAIINQEKTQLNKGDKMELKDLSKVLACSEDDIMEKTKTIITQNSELAKEVEGLKVQNSELINVKETLETQIAKQNDIIAENEVNLAVANSQIKEDQKAFALSLYKKDKALYDEFIKTTSKVEAPQGNLIIPNNENQEEKLTYSILLSDPVKLAEYKESNPEQFYELRQNYLNGGE